MDKAKDLCVILGGKHLGGKNSERANVAIFDNINIKDSIRLAGQLEEQGAKALICTAGSYRQISRQLNIPVIPITMTLFDLLNVVSAFEKEPEPAGQKIACIFHSGWSMALEKIQPFVKSRLYLYQYRDESELSGLIKKISADGADAVIAGSTSAPLAKSCGLKISLMSFGPETMTMAIDKGQSVLDAVRNMSEVNVRMKTIVNLFSYGIIITDNNGTVTACNPSGLQQLALDSRQIVGRKIYEVIKDDSWINSYANGKQALNMLKRYGRDRFFVSDHPLILPDNSITGSVATFQKAEDVEKMEWEYRRIKNQGLTAKYEFKDIIGQSPAILHTIEKARAYANADSTILIEGATGSGKEIFAQSIHNASARRYGPFVALNCAALPEQLLESELMGYEEGAFTGARRGGKTGLLELADKGTIFLDEIHQITPSMQARLLRIIQEKQILRLGGNRMTPVNVRIIAAANESLEKKVFAGSFREDLFYRLNVLNLAIPDVKERKSDIPLLLDFFLKQFAYKGEDSLSFSRRGHGPRQDAFHSDNSPVFSSAALAMLTNYNWPGNIREIYNFAERYSVLAKNRSVTEQKFVQEYIQQNRLSPKEESRPDKGFIKIPFDTLANIEKEVIKQALTASGGNRACAAFMLGISRTSLWKKLKNITKRE